MTKEEFNKLLKDAQLSQKELSILLKTSNQTVNNWGSNGRNFPYWVSSWLKLYIENKEFQQLKEICQNIGTPKK